MTLAERVRADILAWDKFPDEMYAYICSDEFLVAVQAALKETVGKVVGRRVHALNQFAMIELRQELLRELGL